jgi:hypothetical protein
MLYLINGLLQNYYLYEKMKKKVYKTISINIFA